MRFKAGLLPEKKQTIHDTLTPIMRTNALKARTHDTIANVIKISPQRTGPALRAHTKTKTHLFQRQQTFSEIEKGYHLNGEELEYLKEHSLIFTSFNIKESHAHNGFIENLHCNIGRKLF